MIYPAAAANDVVNGNAASPAAAVRADASSRKRLCLRTADKLWAWNALVAYQISTTCHFPRREREGLLTYAFPRELHLSG